MLSHQFRVTIAISTALSTPVCLDGYRLCGLIIPTLNGTPDITFQMAEFPNSPTYLDILDNTGTEVEVESAAVTAAANGGYMAFTQEFQENFAGVANIKIRTGTAQTPVNQSSPRTIVLVARKD